MSDHSRKRRVTLIAILASCAILLTGSIAYAIAALNVQFPFLPAVGQSTAQPCDANGVTTTFTYGNSSANGMKVTSVTVTGIDAACATATVEFVSNGAVIDPYSGSVTAGTFTKATAIFTNQFDDVRVSLLPRALDCRTAAGTRPIRVRAVPDTLSVMSGTPDADDWHQPDRPSHPDMLVILDLLLEADAASAEGNGAALITAADQAAGGRLASMARIDADAVADEASGPPASNAAATAWATGFMAGVRVTRDLKTSDLNAAANTVAAAFLDIDPPRSRTRPASAGSGQLTSPLPARRSATCSRARGWTARSPAPASTHAGPSSAQATRPRNGGRLLPPS